MGPRLARSRRRLLPGNDNLANVVRNGVSRPRSMQKPGIDDEPNDGAEHGRDQHAAGVFIELVHWTTMPRMELAIKSQLNQN